MCGQELVFREAISVGADIATILSPLVYVFITVFAWVKFWPDIIRQKRLENAKGNSWKVLGQIDDAEEAIRALFLANKERECNERQNQKRADVIAALRSLSTGLLTLQGLTPDFSDQRDWFDQVFYKYEELFLAVRGGEMDSSSASVDLLMKLGETPFSQEGPKFEKLEELKKSVAAIAGLYHTGL